MTSQFSPRVSEILAFSREEAARLASRSVGPEHLLLGMLRNSEGPVIDLFHRLNLNLQSVKTELEQRVREDEIGMPIHTTDLVLNEKASNILKLAVLEARIQRTTKVDEQHLLLAILHDAVNNGAKQVLELNNMNYEDAMAMLFAQKNNSVTNNIDLPDEEEDEFEDTTSASANASKAGAPTTTQKKPASKTPVLDTPCSTPSAPTSHRLPLRVSSTPAWAVSERYSASSRYWAAERRTIPSSSENRVWARVPSSKDWHSSS